MNLPAGPGGSGQNNPQNAGSGNKPTGGNTNAPPPANAPAGAPAAPNLPMDAAPAGSVRAQAFEMEGDPAYAVGERYFLALEAGPDNTERPVGPAGRYKVNGNNQLEAVSDDDVSQSVTGLDLARVKAAAQGQAHIPTRTRVHPRETTQIPGMPTTGVPETIWMLLLIVAGVAISGTGLVLRRRRA